MTETPLVLALDQGGQSTRAALYDTHGRAHARARMKIATLRPAPAYVEHDAEQLVDSLLRVIGEVLADEPSVAAAGLATQRSSIALWDRETGAALAPVISWQDTRADALLRRLAPAAATIRATTGLVPSAHYGASKLRWCLDELPAVRAAARDGCLAAGPLASFLAFRLCAARPLLADPVNASRTLLWDLADGDWSQMMLDAFGIPRTVLPRCVPNRYEFGELPGREIPLRVCTGDQNAALYAASAPDNDRLYINIGTGAFVLAPVDVMPAQSRLLRSVVFDDGAQRSYALEGTVNGAASALAAAVPAATRSAIAEAAAQIGRESAVPLFLNGVSGLGSPFWSALQSRFVGRGDAHARCIAVLESILFLIQVNIENVPGAAAREIAVSGGLANYDGLCAALASLCGCVVVRSRDTEATARGLAALVAGLPPGADTLPAASFTPRPLPALTRRYRHWRDALAAALEDQGAAQQGRKP